MASEQTPREILEKFIDLRSGSNLEAGDREQARKALAQMRDPAGEPTGWTTPEPKAVRRRG